MRVIFTWAFILALHHLSFSQKINYGIKTGLNASVLSVSVASNSSFKSGFHFGGYVKRKLSTILSLRTELYYSNQGEKDEYSDMPNHTIIGTTTTNINYINLPMLLQIGNKFNFHGGVQIGFLLSATESGEFQGTPYFNNLKDLTNPVDFSYVLGVGYDTNHITIGTRINMGLSKIFENGYYSLFPPVTHKVIHFYVGYIF